MCCPWRLSTRIIFGIGKESKSVPTGVYEKQEGQFFDAMRLDLELEQKIKEFTERKKLITRVTREFVVKVEM